MTAPPGIQAQATRSAEPLPALTAALSPGEALGRLAAASKRGRLAGFVRQGGASSACRVAIEAGAYDHDLLARFSPLADDPAAHSCVTFDLRLRRRTPAVVVVIVLISFWPGLPLTDTMLRQSFLAYNELPIETWWWYIPLMVISLPALWKQFRSSQRRAREEARKVIGTIADLLT